MSDMLFYLSQFWRGYGDFIINFLISSGISLVIIKFWLKTRLKAIDHKYSEKIEIIKSGLSKEITHQAAVYSSFSEAQKAAMERKLLAIDKLWQTLIEFRENLPMTLNVIDINAWASGSIKLLLYSFRKIAHWWLWLGQSGHCR